MPVARLTKACVMLLCLALVIWQPWIAMYLVDGKLPW